MTRYGFPSLHLPHSLQTPARKVSASRRAVTLPTISGVSVTSGPRHSFSADRQAPTRCLRQASGPLLSRYETAVAKTISASASGESVCIGYPRPAPKGGSPWNPTVTINYSAQHAVCMVNAHVAAPVCANATVGDYPIAQRNSPSRIPPRPSTEPHSFASAGVMHGAGTSSLGVSAVIASLRCAPCA